MISRKEAALQAPATGSLIMVITLVFSMGGFPAAGETSLDPRITILEENISQTQIKIASIQTDIKHYENLMEKQSEQNDKIYDLLLQLCQGMASSSGHKCS